MQAQNIQENRKLKPTIYMIIKEFRTIPIRVSLLKRTKKMELRANTR